MAEFGLLLLVVFVLTILLLFSSFILPTRNQNIPPLLSLRHLLNKSFMSLSIFQHLRCLPSIGPIFTIRLNSHLMVFISSASVAEDCFSQNDIVLANRPHFLLISILNYNSSTVISAPYGPRWLFLRKTCTAQIFSSLRLHTLSHIWSEAAADLVRKIVHQSSECNPTSTSKVVLLRPLFREMLFEILMRILTGEIGELGIIMDIIGEVMEHTERLNVAEFFPFLRWVGFGGYEKKLKRTCMAVDGLLQRIVDKRRSRSQTEGREDNLIDNLLELQLTEPDSYDDEMIKGLVLVMLSAGSDTTVANLEWAMSLLLNHPSIMSKAKNEIDLQVGKHRPVNKSDLLKLPYLHNIILETLRLYPPGPLLLPHFSSQDCTTTGYTIPSGTTVIVNAREIHRDPNLWEEPSKFKPERFEGRSVSAYQFMPFGLGRRGCPGAGLAKHVVGLALASLIQCFEWERLGEEEVNMTERDALTNPKAQPLEAVCKPRPACAAYM